MNYSAGKYSRKNPRHAGLAAVVAGLLLAAHGASAQLGSPQGVYNSVPMVDAFGSVLPGTNPYLSNECAVVSGCLVEILSDGSNNVAHVANLDGSPSGGDTILFTVFVGQGDPDCVTYGGEFSTSFYPPPTAGTKIYARVFNAPTLGQAGYWGQSADFTVTNIDNQLVSMDLSVLGLKATTMPKGVNLSTIDSKGFTYLYELTANTNPQNPTDLFTAASIEVSSQGGHPVQVGAMGHAGRSYTLQRSLDLAIWSNVTSSVTGVLTADTSLILDDPSPPVSSKLFYRVDVTMP
jgi:hypothetical protein